MTKPILTYWFSWNIKEIGWPYRIGKFKIEPNFNAFRKSGEFLIAIYKLYMAKILDKLDEKSYFITFLYLDVEKIQSSIFLDEFVSSLNKSYIR